MSLMLFGHPCAFHCIRAIGQTFCLLCVKDNWGTAQCNFIAMLLLHNKVPFNQFGCISPFIVRCACMLRIIGRFLLSSYNSLSNTQQLIFVSSDHKTFFKNCFSSLYFLQIPIFAAWPLYCCSLSFLRAVDCSHHLSVIRSLFFLNVCFLSSRIAFISSILFGFHVCLPILSTNPKLKPRVDQEAT